MTIDIYFQNYKPPGAKDIPIDFRVQMTSKTPNPVGVLRSKGTAIFWVLFSFNVYIPCVHNFQLFQYPSTLILAAKKELEGQSVTSS
jgi:hypothetical protein